MTQRSGSETRRGRIRLFATVGIAVAGAMLAAACGAPASSSTASSAEPVTATKPASPIAITVLDGAGDLAGGAQPTIEAFAKEHPDLISNVTFQTAAATDISGKVKAQQTGGAVDISLVLGGPDVLGAGVDQNLYMKLYPDQAANLPDLNAIQDEPRQQYQALADGYGVLVGFDQSGPLIASNPTTVNEADVPTTPEELLAWAQAHPGKFTYAAPPGSGSGRAFLQSLPYMLGDSDPSDPVNGWSKTWAYLQELGKNVSSYPASSTLLAQQFGGGQVDLIPTIIAHDISNRKSGTWPADTNIATFQDQNWISDGHFAMIPNGVSPATVYVVDQIISELVKPDPQALRLTTGVLTTANKDVTVENGGQAVTDFVQQWGRPDFYPKALESGTVQTPLTPEKLQQAFDLWSRNVASNVGG